MRIHWSSCLGLGALSLSLLAATASAAPINPTAAWLFDEAEGVTIEDAFDADGAQDGVLAKNGTAATYFLPSRVTDTPLTGPSNQSVYFTSGKNLANGFPDTFNFEHTARFSVSFWMKSGGGASQAIIGRHDTVGGSPDPGWVIREHYSGNRMQITMGDSNGKTLQFATTAGYTLNQWNQVVVTYDGSGANKLVNIYLNGVKQSFSVANPFTGSTLYSGGFALASRNAGAGGLYTGYLDEVAIWSGSILTDADVAWLQTHSLAGMIPEPAAASLLVGAALMLVGRARRS